MGSTEQSMSMESRYITHLRFFDDIVLMPESLQDLQIILSSLNTAHARRVGLGINLDKTKVMFNHVTPKPIYVENVALEVVYE